jgi:hypothetical protein
MFLLEGWNEIPEVIGSTGMAILGMGFASFGLWNYYRKDGDNRRYKFQHVIYRDTDPRAKTIRED